MLASLVWQYNAASGNAPVTPITPPTTALNNPPTRQPDNYPFTISKNVRLKSIILPYPTSPTSGENQGYASR